jgi:hypothetical protein
MEANSSRHAIGVWNNAVDVEPEIMVLVGIGADAHGSKFIAHMWIAEETENGRRWQPIDPHGFPFGYREECGAVQDTDNSIHGVQNGVRGEREFSNRKILGSFVVSEAHVNSADFTKLVSSKDPGIWYQASKRIIKFKICSDKSNRFASPESGLSVDRNAMEMLFSSKTWLGILAQTRTGEDAETSPVPNGTWFAQEGSDCIGERFSQISSLGGKHTICVRFFARLGFCPNCPLSNQLVQSTMRKRQSRVTVVTKTCQ